MSDIQGPDGSPPDEQTGDVPETGGTASEDKAQPGPEPSVTSGGSTDAVTDDVTEDVTNVPPDHEE